MNASPGRLPVYFRRRNGEASPHSNSAAAKWVHAIPMVVFLCLFILWWWSYPVDLVIKDGAIAAINRVEMPVPVTHHVELTILTSAISPAASVPLNITAANDTTSHPVSKSD